MMKFTEKENIKELDTIVTLRTSSEFQTKYSIFVNPWNTKQASFTVNCIYIPKDPHFLAGETKKNKFEDLYNAVAAMLENSKVQYFDLTKNYFPNADNPYSLEITFEEIKDVEGK